MSGSKLLVGGISSFLIVWILMQYDERLAYLYMLIVFLSVILLYKDEFFPALNVLIGWMKGQ